MTAPTPSPELGFDIVAIAASAGGLTALTTVLGPLGADWPTPIVVVQHLDPRHRSLLAEIISRRTQLEVRQATNGSMLAPGVVDIAPPDHHLLVNSDSTLCLTQSELINFVRPSADLLFESVAGTFGSRSIGVVLTGTGSDGSVGVDAFNRVGATVIVENPETAEFSGMPNAALSRGRADFVLDSTEIADALERLVWQGGRT